MVIHAFSLVCKKFQGEGLLASDAPIPSNRLLQHAGSKWWYSIWPRPRTVLEIM